MSLLRYGAAAVLLSAVAGVWCAELAVLEPGSAAQLTALGNEALMQGRYETAIDHYRRALVADKQAFQPTFNLALAYQQKGSAEEAKHWYEAALALRNDHPEVLCNLGYLAFQGGDYAGAVERFQAAARQAASAPADAADYWFNAGTARERQRQWSDARRAYEECLALNPRHAGGHFNLGTLYLGPLADQPQALAIADRHLVQACELAPKEARMRVNLALCRERSGSGDPEKDLAAALAVADAASLPQVLWQRARFHDRSHPPRKTAMRDDLKRLLEVDKDFPGANGMLGAYLFAIADYEGAIRHLEREVAVSAAAGHKDQDECHYLLALIYTDHRPEPTRALTHATAYYQAHPDSAKIHELRRRALRLSASVTQ
jgi:tetratricopeptide (TPR) repeat protein